jgi:hypothetical protein
MGLWRRRLVRRSWLILPVLATVAAGVVLSVTGHHAATPPKTSFLNPFPPNSVWSAPLKSPTVDRDNTAKMQYWLQHAVVEPSMGLRRYGIAIVQASHADPRYTVRCVIYACPSINRFGRVAIPRGTLPDPGTDGHLVIFDAARQLEWDFWISHCPDNCSEAGAGSVLSTAKLNPHGASNASGFPGLAGIVHPEEVIRGHIDHPLVFAMPGVRRGFVCPASMGAGTNDDPLALPEGTLMQLDPALDVSKLGLPRWQRVIAHALQRYGMYLKDGSPNLQIYAENPVNRGDMWAKAGLLGDYAQISSDFPWSHMRVLVPPRPWC